MISIHEAAIADLPLIREIAYKTWPETYGHILSAAQVDFMLDLFYSEEILLKNMTEKGHHFLLANENGNCLGFASYEHQYTGINITRLHKIYLLREAQGKGAGIQLLNAVERAARQNHSMAISLNVNRFNKAKEFYLKAGYIIMGEENLEIGHGYLMEDYKMEKWM
jgi:GNAT superfamily N-acetyltransferase